MLRQGAESGPESSCDLGDYVKAAGSRGKSSGMINLRGTRRRGPPLTCWKGPQKWPLNFSGLRTKEVTP
jgi:hypothetical protein